MRTRFVCGALVSAWLCAEPAAAQQFRGSVTGRVVDVQEAVVPNVVITATNLETQARYQTETNAAGQYTLPYLQPGPYRLEAEARGFKRYVRERIQVSANEPLSLDITLELGQVVETVTVTADAPVLTTATASTGQVITSRFIENLPMNGRTPLSLAQIAFGVIPLSDPRFQRPFDNAGPADFSMGGAPGRTNELLLDGAPDTTRDRRVAYNPPVDSVTEVKVETFQADAAYGNTGGGTVNVVLRGGTNEFHGNAYNFNQVSRTAATDFFVNKAGQTKSQLVYNQWGVNAGAPLYIPKLLDGRNRVFWYFAYEGIKDRFPEPVTTTVPTDAMRRGDFSQLLSLGSVYQIYDPATGVREGARVRRQPFPNNTIPRERLNPIALRYLEFFPQPNQRGAPDGQNNYLANTTRGDDYNSELGRLDFNLSDRHKFFFNFRHNERLEFRGNLFKNIATGNFLKRINWGSTFDDVYSFTPTTVLNTRLNWMRWTEGNRRPSLGFDMTTLGFPASLARASAQALLPQVVIAGFPELGHDASIPLPYDQFQVFTSLSKFMRGHSLKFGADLRLYRESGANLGRSSGRYEFGTSWVQGPLDNSPAAPFGQSFASFLLGLPTGGSFDVGTFRSNQAGYWALFVQDDWKVTPTLTLNLGVRLEREMTTTERFDRQIVGFDGTTPNQVTEAAKAAYAASPIPELPVARFNPVGGLIFARPGRRGIAEMDFLVSPRFGFAWSPEALGRKTVLRGGVGMYYFTAGLQVSQQPGYFQRTPFVATLDGFLTPAATLSNPFPSGIQQPVGNAQGINTFLGQSVSFYHFAFDNPYSLRWNFTIQRELASNTVFEVGYMGNHAVRLTGNRGLNWVPEQFLSTLPVRDQPVIDRMTANVANPFRNLLPGTGLNGSTVPVNQLLRAFPQFTGDGGVTILGDNFGSSFYHMLQARLERRLARGFAAMVNYQYSKLLEKRTFLNLSDRAPEKRVANEDVPHRVVVSGVYELPFGRGKALAGGAGPVLDRLIGGWSLNGIYTFASGQAIGDWGNVIYFGGDLRLNPRAVDGAFDTSRFERASARQLAWNIRRFPTRFGNLREAATNNFDISILKDTTITERVRLQYRAEFFNALNHPQFDSPNISPTSAAFGTITRQENLPRTIQMALKLIW
ncbi:MAG: carboxypeptidase regulatory-like domain-containing protein [Bryobacterales bacterium]|nr:carboxypeptidase regulatory-like domain-containing protein [Bryobacteraceae bacterium]MDW8355860.1 carboxypeptidase regulatory-like domain-containing protein [Bryobacterales bacterium]